MLSLTLLLAANVIPVPAQVRYFGDWGVACDNGWRCEAVSMLPEVTRGFARFSMKVVREAGPRGAISVRIESGPMERSQGDVALIVDGWTLASGTLDRDGGMTVSGASATRLISAMTDGELLSLSLNGEAAMISLKGVAATWRYMDVAQHRTGTVSALSAKGTAIAVPTPPALPVVYGVRMHPGFTLVEGQFRKQLLSRADCDLQDEGVAWATRHRLDRETAILLVRCGAGAYNSPETMWLLHGGRLSTPKFDYLAETLSLAGGLVLYPSFDETSGLLVNAFAFRGMGDCAREEYYAWDGARFRLVEAAWQGQCRGTTFRPTTWRACVVWRQR